MCQALRNHASLSNLLLQEKKEEEKKEEGEEPPKKKASILGIGVQGGFEGDANMEQEETYALVVLPEFTSFPITSDELPEKVGGPSHKFCCCTVASCR
jgi:hypothetical protein